MVHEIVGEELVHDGVITFVLELFGKAGDD
jgi:hypothetical protein